ncbi:hypothetical protein [Pseudomonas sp. TMB3-21]
MDEPRNIAMANGFRDIVTALKDESDRGTVVLAAAWLDESLTNILKKLFKETDKEDLLSPGKALGDFGTKILIAERLKLINPHLVQSLTICRRLRNDFAHLSSNLSFSTNTVKGRVENLFKLNESIISTMAEVLLDAGLNLEDLEDGDFSARRLHQIFGTKQLFGYTCGFINSGLAVIEFDTQEIEASFSETSL